MRRRMSPQACNRLRAYLTSRELHDLASDIAAVVYASPARTPAEIAVEVASVLIDSDVHELPVPEVSPTQWLHRAHRP